MWLSFDKPYHGEYEDIPTSDVLYEPQAHCNFGLLKKVGTLPVSDDPNRAVSAVSALCLILPGRPGGARVETFFWRQLCSVATARAGLATCATTNTCATTDGPCLETRVNSSHHARMIQSSGHAGGADGDSYFFVEVYLPGSGLDCSYKADFLRGTSFSLMMTCWRWFRRQAHGLSSRSSCWRSCRPSVTSPGLGTIIRSEGVACLRELG